MLETSWRIGLLEILHCGSISWLARLLQGVVTLVTMCDENQEFRHKLNDMVTKVTTPDLARFSHSRHPLARHRQGCILHRRHWIRAIIRGPVAAGVVVSAVADPAEGKGAADAGGLAVPVDDAGADLSIKKGPQGCVIAEESRRQSIC